MRNTLLLTINTLRVTLRKKSSLFVYFLVPLIGIVVSMVAYGNWGDQTTNIGVCNQDSSVLAADLVKSLGDEGKFTVNLVASGDVKNELAAGKVECVLVIPNGFGAAMQKGAPKKLDVLSIKGEAATAWLTSYLNVYVKNVSDIGKTAKGDKQDFEKIYQNFKATKTKITVKQVQDSTNAKSMTTQSIGFLVMFLLIGAGNTAEIILKEKRARTFYRVCAAPVSPRVFVAGNALANLVIILLQILVSLVVMINVFHFQTYVPFGQLFIVLAVFGLVAIGLGLLLVAFAKDTKQTSTMQLLIVTPTCMLAGCFWPTEVMPKVAQRIGDFLPQKWVIAAVQQLQETGLTTQVYTDIAIILAFALAFFLIAAYGFGRQNDVRIVN